MSNINWDFILEQEGFETTGYVPDAENSKSGVTIASGFDLGARKESDLKGLPEDIIALLTPFLGFTGAEASEIAPNLKVSEDQAKIINEFAKSTELAKLKTKWQNATGTNFDDLPTEQATVLTSVAFQYGDLESRTPNFWKQTTSGDWVGAYKNLLNFGDRYESRRLNEAQLLWGSGTLKKSIEDGTSTGILSDEAQSALNNVIEAVPDMVEPVAEVAKTVDDSTGNFITNFISDLQDINEKYKLEGKTELEKIEEQYALEQEQKETNAEIASNEIEDFRITNKDEIRNELLKQNEELAKYDPMAGHTNPSWQRAIPDIPIVSQREQDQLDKANKEYQDELAKKYGYWDMAKAGASLEWVSSWLLKHAQREELSQGTDWQMSDFVPDKQQVAELLEGVNPEHHATILESGATLPEMRIIKNKILDVQEKEAILMSKGFLPGLTTRLLAAILDPTAIAAAVVTDGVMAPAIVMNKANRIQRIIRGGFAAATTNAAIEGVLVTQNPTLDTDDVLIAVAAGFVLGGTIRGLRKTKIDENDVALNKAVNDLVDSSDKTLIHESGLKQTTKGTKKYDKVKTAQDDYDEAALKYEKTIVERTTGRTDGNVEIRMPDGKDEYIVTKDGKVIKCKQ